MNQSYASFPRVLSVMAMRSGTVYDGLPPTHVATCQTRHWQRTALFLNGKGLKQQSQTQMASGTLA